MSGAATDTSSGRVAAVLLVAGSLLTALLALAIVHRDREHSPTFFVPTYVPDGFDSNEARWHITIGDDSKRSDYGHIGPDDRLDRWLQLRTTNETIDGPPTEVLNGRSIWVHAHAPTEFRGVLDIPACSHVRYWSVGITADAILAALSNAHCADGYPVVDAFSSMRQLCVSTARASRVLDVPTTDPTTDRRLLVEASVDDCPLETVTGLAYGVEHYEEIHGRHTEIWIDADSGRAGATFRVNHRSIFATLAIDPNGIDVGDEIVKIAAGLRRVDNAEWQRLTAPP